MILVRTLASLSIPPENTMKPLSIRLSLSLVSMFVAFGLLSGCATSISMPDTAIDNPGNSSGGTPLHGVAMGGQQPIIAGHVYMFEAHGDNCYGLCNPNSNPITYGTAPTSLLGASGGYSCNFPLINDGSGLCYYKTTGVDPSGNPSNLPPGAGNGEFFLNNTYACTPGDQVWLLSLSGYTTTSGGAEALNPYAGLMASLGQCPSAGNFSSDHYIFMNELSTAAMAYAIAGFAGPTTQTHYGTKMVISTDTTNVVGFNQAFANAKQLYNVFQDNPATNQPDQSAPHITPVGAGIPPYYLLNTVADMLAACINSAILSAPTNCANLFSGAYGNGTQVTDTASVAIQIAQVPNAPGLDELLALSTTDGPWFPNNTNPSAPYGGEFPDLTAGITYTVAGTGNLSGSISPSGIAVDAGGNVFTSAFNTKGYMVKVSPLGVLLGSTSPLSPVINTSTSLALDSTGLIWADGYNKGNVYEVNGVSSFLSVTNFNGTPLTQSIVHPVAADKIANVFFADDTLGELYWVAGGVVHAPITSTSCTANTNGVGSPGIGVNNVAVDSNNNLWVTNGGTYTVCHISEATSPTILAHAGATQKIYEADGVAVDSGNNGWVYGNGTSQLFQVGNTSGVVKGSFAGAGLDAPTGIAIDGLNNVFLVNDQNQEYSGGSISEFNSSGIAVSPPTYGFQAANVDAPTGIAIDISGNIWVANYGATDLLEVIGAAAPTAGPLSAGKPGNRP
jgi:hypothetical protein